MSLSAIGPTALGLQAKTRGALSRGILGDTSLSSPTPVPRWQKSDTKWGSEPFTPICWEQCGWAAVKTMRSAVSPWHPASCNSRDIYGGQGPRCHHRGLAWGSTTLRWVQITTEWEAGGVSLCSPIGHPQGAPEITGYDFRGVWRS